MSTNENISIFYIIIIILMLFIIISVLIWLYLRFYDKQPNIIRLPFIHNKINN